MTRNLNNYTYCWAQLWLDLTAKFAQWKCKPLRCVKTSWYWCKILILADPRAVLAQRLSDSAYAQRTLLSEALKTQSGEALGPSAVIWYKRCAADRNMLPCSVDKMFVYCWMWCRRVSDKAHERRVLLNALSKRRIYEVTPSLKMTQGSGVIW